MVEFSTEVFDTICDRLADGESLRSICRDDDMPAAGTVCRWLSEDEGGKLREQYARARELQADALFDEVLDIADNASNDWMERNGSGGGSEGWQLNGEHIQRSRVRIDARKWMAGKLRPKVYGDRQAVDHTSSDGSMTPKEVLPDELVSSLDAIASKLSGSDSQGEMAGDGEAETDSAGG